jgi:Leucine-rich repeat (LRR) protein
MALKIFISYTHLDREIVKTLAEDLGGLGHEVWYDKQLDGGREWWRDICEQIRICDVFIFALSPTSLNSKACQQEWTYANDLGKNIWPIQVADKVNFKILPTPLTKLKATDYRQQDKKQIFVLRSVLDILPPVKDLPVPLPDEPDAPLSLLNALRDRANRRSLTLDEQKLWVADLRPLLQDPEEAKSARELAEIFLQREDIMKAIDTELNQLLTSSESDWAKALLCWLEEMGIDDWFCPENDKELRQQRRELRLLTELDLSKSEPYPIEIPSEIGYLANLEELNLNHTGVYSLPPEIGQLANLQVLDLSENGPLELPPEIGQLSNLQTLDLSESKLVELPPEIGQLSNLQTLDLSENELVELPPEIGQLSNLQVLRLRQNELVGLPPEIGQLANLEIFDLNINSLQELPPEIGRLSNLYFLGLMHNVLTEFPAEISQLTNLVALEINGNCLTELPSEIGQLTNLERLYLSDNALTELPVEIGQLINLETLDLSENNLTELPVEIGQLVNLKTLYLSGNPLKSIPPEILALNIPDLRLPAHLK